METSHEEWVHQAIVLAAENVRTGRGGPFGALVVKDGQVVASGVNQVATTNDPTSHAEVNAIRAACAKLATFQLNDCDLYASCEPCPMCLGAIYWARPRAYYYAGTRDSAAVAGFDDLFIYNELHLSPEKRSIPGYCLATGKADAPFIEWAQSVQKIHY